MLKINQSIGNTDATIVTSLHVFGPEAGRETEIPMIHPKAGVPVLEEHVQAKQTNIPPDLKVRHANWMHWFENEIEAKYESTGSGLEIIADVLQEEFEHPECFGLPSTDIFGESRNLISEPLIIAGEQKEHLRRFIEHLAAKMGVQHPDIAAEAAVLVIDETIAHTQMSASPEEAQTARLLFQCLQHA